MATTLPSALTQFNQPQAVGLNQRQSIKKTEYSSQTAHDFTHKPTPYYKLLSWEQHD